MYHGVVKAPLQPFCWTQILETELDYQLRYLKKKYNVLKLSEVLSRIENKESLPDYTAVITFDDGYKNNYTVAYSILKELALPATIFLVTGCISDKTIYWVDQLYLSIKNTKEKEIDLKKYNLETYLLSSDTQKEYAFESIVEYLKKLPSDSKNSILNDILQNLKVNNDNSTTDFDLLTWDEVKEMDKEGLVEFGGHSVTHNILSRLNDGDMEKEIMDSCRIIENRLGKKCLIFAYPNGTKEDFTKKTKEVLEKNSFYCGLSTISGLNRIDEDRYELKRIGIGAAMSIPRFKLLTSGTIHGLKKLIFIRS